MTSVGYMPWETAVLHAKVSRARVESQAVAPSHSRVTAQLDAIAQAIAAQGAFSSVGPQDRPRAAAGVPLAVASSCARVAHVADDLASGTRPRARLRESERDAEMLSVSNGGDHDDETLSVVSTFDSHASSAGLNEVRKNLGGTWPGPISTGGLTRAELDDKRSPMNLSALQRMLKRSQTDGGKLLDLSDDSEDSDCAVSIERAASSGVLPE